MKLKTKQITFTAIMLALSIVVIFFIKKPLEIAGLNVALSGALINLILILIVMYSGITSGIIASILIPILSFIITGAPIISMAPLILPCIMLGNLVYIIFPFFVRSSKKELNLLPLMLALGCIAKYFVMYFLIVKLVLPSAKIPAKLMTIATIQYSTTQLVAGAVGAVLAILIWPTTRLAVKHVK